SCERIMAGMKPQTVFVLGAGASNPYGFPLGGKLLSLVWESTSNAAVDHPLCKLGHQQAELDAFAEALAASNRPSVDAFLEHRPEFLMLGKRAIALTLARFESDVVFRNPIHKQQCWY